MTRTQVKLISTLSIAIRVEMQEIRHDDEQCR
jgi:hypothetical protein